MIATLLSLRRRWWSPREPSTFAAPTFSLPAVDKKVENPETRQRRGFRGLFSTFHYFQSETAFIYNTTTLLHFFQFIYIISAEK